MIKTFASGAEVRYDESTEEWSVTTAQGATGVVDVEEDQIIAGANGCMLPLAAQGEPLAWSVALWLSAESGMEIYDMTTGETYIAAKREDLFI
jgi:hypothetical protein